MNNKIFIIAILSMLIASVTITSCKKNAPKTVNANSPHALSDEYYVRGLLDTTWKYNGNGSADECQTTGSVCSDFLVYGPNYSLLTVKITLTDSAHPNPQDTTMLKWVGKTFVTASDVSASHAYLFSFEYPDTAGREMSSDYVANNTGATLTIDSVVYNGLSQQGYTDSAGNALKAYRIKGTLSCKLTHFGDSVIHNFSQGVYSINVLEAK
jgi:hypothetical protein